MSLPLLKNVSSEPLPLGKNVAPIVAAPLCPALNKIYFIFFSRRNVKDNMTFSKYLTIKLPVSVRQLEKVLIRNMILGLCQKSLGTCYTSLLSVWVRLNYIYIQDINLTGWELPRLEIIYKANRPDGKKLHVRNLTGRKQNVRWDSTRQKLINDRVGINLQNYYFHFLMLNNDFNIFISCYN